MKIILISGCLEPGRDGVGDYTRRLAIELNKNGHLAFALAINDYYTTQVIEEKQSFYCDFLEVLRIPSKLKTSSRIQIAKSWITKHDPNWLSLQFVPFSFHSKGLPFLLSKLLLQSGPSRKWHIMFHELWVGMSKESSLKMILWGGVQKLLIKSLINNVQPKLIHTQTRLYQEYLLRLFPNVHYLPLFSNIPNSNTYNDSIFNNTEEIQSNNLKFVIFGSIHSNALVQDFACEVYLYAERMKVEASLTIIGRPGVEQDKWLSVWKAYGLKVETLSEQSAEQVSDILNTSTIGISTTALAVVEKSGAVAAMKEHGLPILCLAAKWQPRKMKCLPKAEGVFEYKKGIIAQLANYQKNMPAENKLAQITSSFVDTLLSPPY